MKPTAKLVVGFIFITSKYYEISLHLSKIMITDYITNLLF